MKTEVSNLATYSAKRILDQFLAGKNSIDGASQFLAEEIFKDLKNGETKKIIFSNLDAFNTELNKLVWDRINYLVAEGFVEQRGVSYHVRTEEEIEAFVNGNDDDDLAF